MSSNLPTTMQSTPGVETISEVQSDGSVVTASTLDAAGRRGGDAVHELEETPRPKVKALGKKVSEKDELQNHILHILEQDNIIPVEEEDAIDTMFSGIVKRVKKSFLDDEAFTLIHTIQGMVNQYINYTNI